MEVVGVHVDYNWPEGKGGNEMETFGIIGMGLGAMGFIFSLNALAKIAKLEKQLKETGVLNKEYKSE